MFRPGSVYLCPPKLIRYKAGLHWGEIRQKARAILYGAQLGQGLSQIINSAMDCILKRSSHNPSTPSQLSTTRSH